MKKTFIHDDFLLDTPLAQRLFHEVAAPLPIIDYHCHLPPDLIATNHRFRNLTGIWLDGDHYKWRAMRSNGVPERFCTGDASDWEKFERWAATVPMTLRNPLYHWTHLELRRPFGITDRLLEPATARGIWDACNALLAQPGFTTRGLMQQMKVEVVCTTDDPVDALEHHLALARDPSFPVKVLPAFRPDKGMAFDTPAAFNSWADRLEQASGVTVRDFESFLAALQARHDFFHATGCRLSDHGLEQTPYAEFTTAELRAAFDRVRAGHPVSAEAALKLKSAVLHEVFVMNHRRGWVQQLHLGAQRNNNPRMMRDLGPDTGFDSIGDFPQAAPLARFLGRLDDTNRLARTILYNLNPADNEVLATMIGNFQDGSVPGKIQWGSGWWFLDQKDGMERQLDTLSNMGLLRRFVGMLTDSRSFLSYPRHEYFRRILCGKLGREVAQGLLPDEPELIADLVRAVCYENARDYFAFHTGASPSH